jgi:hypothetical protein
MTNPDVHAVLSLDELAERDLAAAERMLAQLPSDPAHDLAVAQLHATVAVGRALLYVGRQLERTSRDRT